MSKQTKKETAKEVGMVAAGSSAVGLPATLIWVAQEVWGLQMPEFVAATIAGYIGMLGGYFLSKLRDK